MKKFIIVLLLLLMCTACGKNKEDANKEKKEEQTIKYTNILYQGKDACLTFIDDHKYSLYDCDSEPTDFEFDSEFNCLAYYSEEENNMTFKCDDNKEVTINIIKWDEKMFKFFYNNKSYTLKAKENEE